MTRAYVLDVCARDGEWGEGTTSGEKCMCDVKEVNLNVWLLYIEGQICVGRKISAAANGLCVDTRPRDIVDPQAESQAPDISWSDKCNYTGASRIGDRSWKMIHPQTQQAFRLQILLGDDGWRLQLSPE